MENYEFKVLVVDDIEENLQIVGNILKENKVAVSISKTGNQAVKIAQKKRPDLILLDINMPEPDGFETCKILKKDKRTKDIPVIFLSALNEKDDIVKGFNYGGVDYITKPFNKAELMSRVFTHLDLKMSRDIIAKQNETLNIQKTKIEDQHNSIMSSIKYAKIIQEAVLLSNDFHNTFFKDSFIIYKPKDIVSGDFYWAKQIQNKIVVAAADCTGHGVPGAFMSMLGFAFLSEIINIFNSFSEIKADLILNELRKKIKFVLHQKTEDNVFADGMNIALCIIDIETKSMQYAGAFNYLYLIRQNEETNTNELKVYDPDKMPIASYYTESPFTSQEILLKTNDIIYLFSDGYYDQIGGKYRKKFLRSQFNKLLLDNSYKPMQEQKKALEDRMSEWKGNYNQVDDIMILGIKIH